jgi:hypothetical protein
MARKFVPLLIAAALPLAMLGVGPAKRELLLIDGPDIAALQKPAVAAHYVPEIDACLKRNGAAVVRAATSNNNGENVTCLTSL